MLCLPASDQQIFCRLQAGSYEATFWVAGFKPALVLYCILQVLKILVSIYDVKTLKIQNSIAMVSALPYMKHALYCWAMKAGRLGTLN